MKTAIVYASVHHGNTKKIIDEIAKTNDVELIDATQTVEKDLSEYDLIGFASGGLIVIQDSIPAILDKCKS